MKETAKILSIVVALTMVLGVFAVMVPSISAKAPTAPAFADPERMDLGPGFRSQTLDMPQMMDAVKGLAPGAAPGDYYAVNDTAIYVWYNFYNSYWYASTFKMRGEGEHCEIWVALNLNFTAGDPRNDWPRLNITDDMVDYMINEFDTVMYPEMAEVFGEPAPLDGTNSLMAEYFGIDDPTWTFQTNDAGKAMIMVFNIRDYSYYNSWYPSYIAGYFSGTSKLVYDRNIIHIDCWDWVNRTGPSSARPYAYETVFVHEWQHLLHDVLDSAEDNWINEGLSMWSEVYVYGEPAIDELLRYVDRYFYTPDNSLTDWEDQGDINSLADYGQVGLFMVYSFDHFGGQDFIEALAHNEERGIVSYEETLADMGYEDWTLADVYRAFSLANLIRSDNPGGGLYNYDTIDLSGSSLMLHTYYPAYGYISESAYGTTWTYEGYDTGISTLGSYGTDYFVAYTGGWPWPYVDPTMLKFMFDGWDDAPVGWETSMVGGSVLFSEDFDNVGSIPSGWTTASYGPTYGYPWFMELDLGSDYHAEANSDDAGPTGDITERLYMTSSFDASAASELYLQFELLYNYYDGDEYARVLYSTSWMWPSFSILEEWSSEDVAGVQLLDLSAAAGDSAVRLAFDYHGTYDYYMEVDDVVVTTSINQVWWSGASDLRDVALQGTADLTGMEEATLTFDTMYEIEELWDFGFVQVSTDGGESWTSLENEYTTSDHDVSAHPAIIENLPGLTGSSGGWMTMSFDLSDYAGQKIKYQFRYMTDWATLEAGWYVDNVYINDVLVDDAGDTVTGLAPLNPNADFMITVYAPSQWTYDGNFLLPMIWEIDVDHMDETAIASFSSMIMYDYVFILVSSTQGPVDYMIGIV